jgi:hypothetical protein
MHTCLGFDTPNYNNVGDTLTMATKNPNVIVDEITGKTRDCFPLLSFNWTL